MTASVSQIAVMLAYNLFHPFLIFIQKWAIDFDEVACKSLQQNHPDTWVPFSPYYQLPLFSFVFLNVSS
jgi:hypothetical protein